MTDKKIEFIMYIYKIVLIIMAILWVVCMVKEMYIEASFIGVFVYAISSGLKLLLKHIKQ